MDYRPLFNDGSPLSQPTVLTASPTLINCVLLSFCLMSGNSFPTRAWTVTFTTSATWEAPKLFIWLCWVLVMLNGIYFLDQGLNPGPLHWELRILTTPPPGKARILGFPGGSVVKTLPASAEDMGLIPGLGRYPGEWNDNPLQYSCLENPMDRGAWL